MVLMRKQKRRMTRAAGMKIVSSQTVMLEKKDGWTEDKGRARQDLQSTSYGKFPNNQQLRGRVSVDLLSSCRRRSPTIFVNGLSRMGQTLNAR